MREANMSCSVGRAKLSSSYYLLVGRSVKGSVGIERYKQH